MNKNLYELYTLPSGLILYPVNPITSKPTGEMSMGQIDMFHKAGFEVVCTCNGVPLKEGYHYYYKNGQVSLLKRFKKNDELMVVLGRYKPWY